MSVTLEQARALDALERHGTFAKAAAALRKGHTAVLYAVRSLEEQTGLTLLDRRGYRTRLTPAGLRIVEHCRRLLAEERALENACAEIQSGWEPELRVVFDGIFPATPILRAVAAIAAAGAKTRIDVTSEFLSGVEQAFARTDADMMVSILPPPSPDLRSVRLAPIRAVLVAHRDHPLGRAEGRLSVEDLASHVLFTVRGSDPRLQLSTAGVEPPLSVRLNDFVAKKEAVLAKMGYGWLPEHLIKKELRSGLVRRVPFRQANVHTFEVRLITRANARPGRAATFFVEHLRA